MIKKLGNMARIAAGAMLGVMITQGNGGYGPH
jgi:hypothetical protein